MFSTTIIIGNLGHNPKLNYTGSGIPVINFSVCTTKCWMDRDGSGKWKTREDWHKVVMFGRSAEHYAKSIKQGDMVVVQGDSQTRPWTDSNGIKRWTTEVVANTIVKLIDRGKKNKAPSIPEHDEVPISSNMGDDVPF